MKVRSLEGERCDFCKNGILESKKVREIYKRNNEIVIIDDVPTFVCNYCGERYFLADVSKKMRAIAESRDRIKNKISVPLAEYGDYA